MRSTVFNILPTALLVLVSILSLQSLGSQELVSIWAKLDPKDPEYTKCLNNECAPYLNITTYCDNLKTDGNFTWDEKIAQQNFLRCACPSPQYLPGLQVCDECIGNNTYPEKKAECDARDGAPSPTTTAKHSATTQTAGASTTSTAGAPTSSTTKTATTDNSAGARVVPMLGLWMGDAGYMLSGSLFGIAAVLAGIM